MSDTAIKCLHFKFSPEDRTVETFLFNQVPFVIFKGLCVKYFDLTDVLLDRSLNLVSDFFQTSISMIII
jgi:hypothetical protein